MIKKATIAVILLVFLSFAFIGCKKQSEDSGISDAGDNKLTAIYSYWPPDMMVYLADKKGFFEEEGLDVNLVKVDGISDAAEKRKTQEIHVWAYPILDFIKEIVDNKEAESRVFLIEDFSEGADGLISYTLSDIGQLVGKKIGAESGTVGEYFLNIVLTDHDIPKDEVEIVNINYADIISSLKDGKIDAGVTYEPDLSSAVVDGATVLADSKTVRRSIVDVYVANESDLVARPNVYRGFAKAIEKAIEFNKNYPYEAADLMYEELGIEKEEVVKAFETLHLPNIDLNKKLFDPLAGHDSIYNLARLAMNYLEDQGQVIDIIELEKLFYKDIVNSI